MFLNILIPLVSLTIYMKISPLNLFVGDLCVSLSSSGPLPEAWESKDPAQDLSCS